MPYEYKEEEAIADIAFQASGNTLEELFASSADAVMNVMIEDLNSIIPKEERSFADKNEELDVLLFDFLQELIFLKDSEQLLLRVKKISLEKKGSEHILKALLSGEQLDPKRHEQRVDVKAVTFHKFLIENTSSGWQAHVILDI